MQVYSEDLQIKASCEERCRLLTCSEESSDHVGKPEDLSFREESGSEQKESEQPHRIWLRLSALET